jgi:DNA-binding GntR family transcriptional regulator
VSVAPAPAGDRAYTWTKERILSGGLPGGHLLSEGDVAQVLGISRTPVREAFLRLQAEQLLTLIPKRGAVVVPVSPGEAEDVLEMREALESAAVARLARRAGPLDEVLVSLRDAIAAQQPHAETRDVPGFVVVDQLFHSAIVGAGGNAIAARFYASLADRQRRMGLLALEPRPEYLAVLVDEHQQLVDRIAARDDAGLAGLLRRHLDATHRALGGLR